MRMEHVLGTRPTRTWTGSSTARASTSSTPTRRTPMSDTVGVTATRPPVIAAVARDNVFATQFHPEKSGEAGLRSTANFVKAVRRVIVIPAIDLRGGRARAPAPGRLRRRRPPTATIPSRSRERFQEQVPAGSTSSTSTPRWARPTTGRRSGRSAAAVDVPVQVGGGMRTLEAAARACSTPGGRGRSSAPRPPRTPTFVGARGGGVRRARGGRGSTCAAATSWSTAGARTGPAARRAIAGLDEAGAPRYLVTAIARDGTLDGPDLDGSTAGPEAHATVP